jgi:4-amino-4-deoxychorismate lyase
MCLLVESIKLLDGNFYNLAGHQQRMNRSLEMLFNEQQPFNLQEFLKSTNHPTQGLYKCRVVYDRKVKEVEFVPYVPRKVKTLKLVEGNAVEYSHKYNDRSAIDRLYTQRGDCDDVLIIKNGMVTDSSYANIVFKKNDRWYTPASVLLPGTMRQQLLDKGIIQTQAISKQDIRSFRSFKLINALLEFEGAEQDILNIIS